MQWKRIFAAITLPPILANIELQNSRVEALTPYIGFAAAN